MHDARLFHKILYNKNLQTVHKNILVVKIELLNELTQLVKQQLCTAKENDSHFVQPYIPTRIPSRGFIN